MAVDTDGDLEQLRDISYLEWKKDMRPGAAQGARTPGRRALPGRHRNGWSDVWSREKAWVERKVHGGRRMGFSNAKGVAELCSPGIVSGQSWVRERRVQPFMFPWVDLGHCFFNLPLKKTHHK